MIETRALEVELGKFRISQGNLKLSDGEYFVLLGPSGSGKTVFIETLMGLHPVKSGSVFIGGLDVTAAAPEDRRVGYIPQDYGLFPHLGVRDNLLFGIRARGLDENGHTRKLDELIDLLEISHLLDRRDVTSLSGGERQRVAIARALAAQPGVLFLDEPFSAIDEFLKQQLLKKLLEIKQALGVTMFHVTHNHQEAFFLGDRIGIMLNGEIAQIGSREEVYHRPASIKVARFLLTRNIFSGVVEEVADSHGETLVRVGRAVVRASAATVLAAGQQVRVGIRPEEVRIEPLPAEWKTCDDSACNAFRAVIKAKNEGFTGLCFEVAADVIDQTIEIEMLKNLACQDRFAVGSEVKICLNRRALWVLPA